LFLGNLGWRDDLYAQNYPSDVPDAEGTLVTPNLALQPEEVSKPGYLPREGFNRPQCIIKTVLL
jgi:hypothetical protein